MTTDAPRPEGSTAGRGLLRSGLVVSSATLISRVSGLLRDWLVAVSFGASPLMDAFFVAFKIPNLLRRLFGEGAFAKGFVPVFTEYRDTRTRAELRALLAGVLGTLGGVLLVVTTVAITAAPVVVLVFAPGFADEADRLDAAASMLRLTFPYLWFVSLVAAAGGVQNVLGHFAVPALTPILLNACLIAAVLVLAPLLDQPEYALAWGVLAAGAVQLAFQLPFLARLGMLPRPRWRWSDPGVRQVFRLMIPALLGAGVYQINQLVNTMLASLLVAGSVSWLYFADRLLEFPMGLIGIAIGTVILPRLASLHTRDAAEDFNKTLGWAGRVVLGVGVPASLLLGLLADEMLSTLFEYGRFDALDRRMAARALEVLALALPATLLINVLAPAFYARQDTRTPVRIGVAAMCVNMAVGAVMVAWGLRSGAEAAHVGLSAAVVVSSWLQVGLLLRVLSRQGGVVLSLRLLPGAAAGLLAAGALVATVLVLQPDVAWWPTAHWLERVGELVLIMAAGFTAWVLVLFACGARPAHFTA